MQMQNYINKHYRFTVMGGDCIKPSQNDELKIKTLSSYLGPVQPIVVPKPPLSFNTTSLSRSFLVSAGSAYNKLN